MGDLVTLLHAINTWRSRFSLANETTTITHARVHVCGEKADPVHSLRPHIGSKLSGKHSPREPGATKTRHMLSNDKMVDSTPSIRIVETLPRSPPQHGS